MIKCIVVYNPESSAIRVTPDIYKAIHLDVQQMIEDPECTIRDIPGGWLLWMAIIDDTHYICLLTHDEVESSVKEFETKAYTQVIRSHADRIWYGTPRDKIASINFDKNPENELTHAPNVV